MNDLVQRLSVASLLAFGGCTSSGTTVNAVPCLPPAGTQVALFYPAPGSAGIPDAIGSVIVATSSALANSWAVELVAPSGAAVTSGAFAITDPPFPTPNAPPSFSATYQGGVLPVLASGTTYHVFLKDTSSSCSASWPGTSPAFTTQ